MSKINLNDKIGYADVIKIIFKEKCVDKYLGNERCIDFTFQEVMELAKTNGWQDGTIMLIAESPLKGKIISVRQLWRLLGGTWRNQGICLGKIKQRRNR